MKYLVVALLMLPAIASAQDTKGAERALRDIDAYATMQAKTDPHYRAVEGALLAEVDTIIKGQAPADWLPAIRRRYVALSEAEHAKEQAGIRASEERLASALGTGDAGWSARLSQLEEELKAGRLGPREHALRAREAAKLYHPGNDIFIAWRAAKVPIATDYELGNITRTEYEDRWNKVTAFFMDRQAADNRAHAAISAQASAEEYRAARELLQQAAPRPIVRCSTTTAFGVTTTRCF